VGVLVAAPIGTERLVLAPLRVQDADEMAGVLDDERLHEFTGGSPEDPARLRTRYQRMLAGSPDPAVTWLNWVVRERTGGKAAGTVQATVTGPRRERPGAGPAMASAEIAWVIGTGWQGRGYASEAAAGLVGWLTGQGVTAIAARIHPGHHRSAAVAARAGLRPTEEMADGERVWRLPAIAEDPRRPGRPGSPRSRDT
jgi:RimJ/RimL family protein N-acetyltransferase